MSPPAARAKAPRAKAARAKKSAARRSADNGRPEVVAPVGSPTIRRRMLVVGLALGLGLVLATGRAVMLQTVGSSELRREAARNYVRTETLDDWRGDILDKSGALLAVTVHRWALSVDPTQIDRPAETAAALAPVVGMSQYEVLERLVPGGTDYEERVRHPATLLARHATRPMAKLLTRVFHGSGARLDRHLDFLEHSLEVKLTANPLAAPITPQLFARYAVWPMAEFLERAFGFPESRLERRLRLLERFLAVDQLQTPAIFPLVNTIAHASEATAAAINASVDGLSLFATGGRRFAYIAHDLDDAAIRALNEAKDDAARHCRELREQGKRCSNPLAQIIARPEPRRYYPKRDLATQLLGLVGTESTGLSGVERGMDAVLAGGQHQVSTIKDQRGRRIFLEGVPADAPLGANSVVLTIDQQIQAVAERELAQACMSSGARAGYVVVQRVKTGEVLAVANFPTYNPNTFQTWFEDRAPLKEERAALAKKKEDLGFAREWALNAKAFPGTDGRLATEESGALEAELDAYVEYQHRFPNAARNVAFLDVYEPGSIMKVFTAAAALEEQVVNLGDVFDLEGGDWELHDAEENVIHDVSRQTEGNLALILKKSSNIGAAKVAFRLGAERLEKYLRAFGFGASTRSGVPGEARGILRPSSQWVPVELANVSFGQGMAATGIQLVTALSALANGGKLMRPLVIKRINDADGRLVREFEPEAAAQVVSEKTARTVLDLMQGVIEPDGTGRRAYLAEYPVAGKTGTGQKPHLRKRGYSEEMWVNTFFGVAPANAPEVAIIVFIDEPSGKRHGGGLVAAPAFKPIMLFTLQHLGIPSPYATAQRQAWLDPEALRKRRETPAPGPDPLLALAPPIDPLAGGDVPVPDFRGLTMDRVRTAATEAGLTPHLYGTGVAIAQDVPAHERVPVGTTVTVTFKSRAPGGGGAEPLLPAPAPAGAALDPPSAPHESVAGGTP